MNLASATTSPFVIPTFSAAYLEIAHTAVHAPMYATANRLDPENKAVGAPAPEKGVGPEQPHTDNSEEHDDKRQIEDRDKP